MYLAIAKFLNCATPYQLDPERLTMKIQYTSLPNTLKIQTHVTHVIDSWKLRNLAILYLGRCKFSQFPPCSDLLPDV